MEKISGTSAFVCPLCGGRVSEVGCANCHLSAMDLQRYGGPPHRWREPWGRGFWTRFIGLVVYGGLIAWSWFFMPATFLFVLPGAIVGAYMQSVRARPLFGAILCGIIVVVVPLLLWTAGLTGVFADLTGGH